MPFGLGQQDEVAEAGSRGTVSHDMGGPVPVRNNALVTPDFETCLQCNPETGAIRTDQSPHEIVASLIKIRRKNGEFEAYLTTNPAVSGVASSKTMALTRLLSGRMGDQVLNELMVRAIQNLLKEVTP